MGAWPAARGRAGRAAGPREWPGDTRVSIVGACAPSCSSRLPVGRRLRERLLVRRCRRAAPDLALAGAERESDHRAADPPSQPTTPHDPHSEPPPMPAPDRFVTVERLDQNAECDALVPRACPSP